jgi:fructoselysine-6-P-deglycase FrlB-like protein
MTADLATMSSHVRQEIGRQPDSWAIAVAAAPDHAGVLPRAGERVAVLGCGTSWFMAQAYAGLRERAGMGETDFFAASEFPAARRYDRVVAISRSGTTSEVLAAIQATGSPVVAISAVPETPVVQAADDAIVLPFADEQSIVQTLFATTALMLLRASLGEQLDGVIAQGRDVLAGAVPLSAAAETAEQFSFLGQGWVHGIAQEAGLKMREAAQMWTEAYPQMEYRHGPIAIAQPGRVVWIFGEPVSGLAADVRSTGAVLVADELDPVADLVRAQLLAVSRAEAQQLDPDRPRSLTRSVVLEDGAGPT